MATVAGLCRAADRKLQDDAPSLPAGSVPQPLQYISPGHLQNETSSVTSISPSQSRICYANSVKIQSQTEGLSTTNQAVDNLVTSYDVGSSGFTAAYVDSRLYKEHSVNFTNRDLYKVPSLTILQPNVTTSKLIYKPISSSIEISSNISMADFSSKSSNTYTNLLSGTMNANAAGSLEPISSMFQNVTANNVSTSEQQNSQCNFETLQCPSLPTDNLPLDQSNINYLQFVTIENGTQTSCQFYSTPTANLTANGNALIASNYQPSLVKKYPIEIATIENNANNFSLPLSGGTNQNFHNSTVAPQIRIDEKYINEITKQGCDVQNSVPEIASLPTVVKKAKKKYTCGVCDKILFSEWGLTTHLRSHSGSKPFKCKCCHYSCVTKSALVKHNRKHNGERPYHCSDCPKHFKTRNSLKLHKKIHTGEKPYECEICGKKFIQKSGKDYHVKLHEKSADFLDRSDVSTRPVKCAECDKTFVSVTSMQLHYENFHPVQLGKGDMHCTLTVKCQYCQEAFRGPSFLEEHVQSKHSDQLLRCTWCMFLCDKPEQLEQHSLLHEENQTTFPCSYCKQVFDTYYEKELHVPTHLIGSSVPYNVVRNCCNSADEFEMENKYEPKLESVGGKCGFNLVYNDSEALICKLCKKRSANMRCLKIHMKMHGKKKVLKCLKCPLEFWHKSRFLKHIEKHNINDEIHKCNYCGKLFKSDMKKCLHKIKCMNYNLNIVRYNNYECPDCGHMAVNLTGLVNHINLVHHQTGPFGCTICGVTFASAVLLKTHNETRHAVDNICLVKDRDIYFMGEGNDCTATTHNLIAPLITSKKPNELNFSTTAKFSRKVSNVTDGCLLTKNKDCFLTCSICDRDFPNQKSFNSHWTSTCCFNTDVGDSLGIASEHYFVCSWCAEVFTSAAEMLVHEVGCHLQSDSTVFSCRSCEKCFTHANYCLEHYRRVHRDQLEGCQMWAIVDQLCSGAHYFEGQRDSVDSEDLKLTSVPNESKYDIKDICALYYSLNSKEDHEIKYGDIDQCPENTIINEFTEVCVIFTGETFSFLSSLKEMRGIDVGTLEMEAGNTITRMVGQRKWKLFR